jgi:hypothetical protein
MAQAVLLTADHQQQNHSATWPMLMHCSRIASQDHQQQMTAAPATNQAAHEQTKAQLATYKNLLAQDVAELNTEQQEHIYTDQQPADTTDVSITTAATYGRAPLDVHVTADLM